jgi:hypothetical protein
MLNTKQLLLFYREKYVFLFCNTALVALLISVGWIAGVIRPRPDTIALHYDIFFGIDRLGPWSDLLSMAAGLAFLILVNAGLAYKIFAKDKYLSYYLLLMGVFGSVFFLVYLVSLTVFALQV